MPGSALASEFVQRPGFDPVRALASSRWSALWSAIRQLREEGTDDAQLSDLVALAEVERAVLNRGFHHAEWCDDQSPGRHDRGSFADYVIGVSRGRGDPAPSAKAEAWAKEEDGAESAGVRLLADSEDDASGTAGWFTPGAARALAAQLVEAADLLESRRRR
ncbi:hypothetical protein SAMN05421854_103376 [Amycolatopsis rubida]|uniref:Uncharacterized protein n=1 Tax=Amycolatopsis rubida TaxID=112413 RepID=A0A1I5KZC3_9PSEU|nr:hypothetical protein SAMN05421854_103376 [Amycolatopsis rubida]